MSGVHVARIAAEWLAENRERKVTIRTAACVTTDVRFRLLGRGGQWLIEAQYLSSNAPVKLIDADAVISINLHEPTGSEL